MFRGLMLAAGAAAISFASAAHADDLWRSQFEVGSLDVFHKANSESLRSSAAARLAAVGFRRSSPAAWYTTKNAFMGYAGITYDLHITDNILILPDAAVGFYQHGDDKNLGNTAEFRTGIGVAYEFDNGWRLGADIHHISNAGLSKKNPGVEIAAIPRSRCRCSGQQRALVVESVAQTRRPRPRRRRPPPQPKQLSASSSISTSRIWTPAAQDVVHSRGGQCRQDERHQADRYRTHRYARLRRL